MRPLPAPATKRLRRSKPQPPNLRLPRRVHRRDAVPLTRSLAQVDGVGKSTAAKVDEILQKGTFDKLEELRTSAQAL
jgi:hypothetical protein